MSFKGGTIVDLSGRTLSGQTTEAFIISVSHIKPFWYKNIFFFLILTIIIILKLFQLRFKLCFGCEANETIY
jgi:hypothetical protein